MSFSLGAGIFMYHLSVKICLFGSRGYLGAHFLALYPDAVCPSADIADPRAVAEVLDREKPDTVINCAGKTGRPNVDWCETHKEETLRSNVTGPLVLLEECGKRGILWVHLSSGCVYEGDRGGRGFSEDDPPNFFGSYYSRTKAWSEMLLKEFPVLIVRLRMPFDGSANERNLLQKLKKYERVLDVPNSITHLPDFLRAVASLIEKRKLGIYNIVNDGPISPYRIMELYREIVDPSHVFKRLTLSDLPSVVKAGRSNCVLSIEKLRAEGIEMPTAEEAVRKALFAIRGS